MGWGGGGGEGTAWLHVGEGRWGRGSVDNNTIGTAEKHSNIVIWQTHWGMSCNLDRSQPRWVMSRLMRNINRLIEMYTILLTKVQPATWLDDSQQTSSWLEWLYQRWSLIISCDEMIFTSSYCRWKNTYLRGKHLFERKTADFGHPKSIATKIWCRYSEMEVKWLKVCISKLISTLSSIIGYTAATATIVKWLPDRVQSTLLMVSNKDHEVSVITTSYRISW